jgi:SsrA-binding protein
MNTMEEKSKAIATNRKARYEYEIIGNMEAGLVLVGSEVKALREGRVNISDAYARVKKGELWIIGMHISPYKQAAFENHEPLRERKALLRKQEIKKLFRRIEEKGVTLIPLRVYFKNKWAKVDLGIARGKRKYDKKETIAQRDAQRDLEREQKKYKFKM